MKVKKIYRTVTKLNRGRVRLRDYILIIEAFPVILKQILLVIWDRIHNTSFSSWLTNASNKARVFDCTRLERFIGAMHKLGRKKSCECEYNTWSITRIWTIGSLLRVQGYKKLFTATDAVAISAKMFVTGKFFQVPLIFPSMEHIGCSSIRYWNLLGTGWNSKYRTDQKQTCQGQTI